MTVMEVRLRILLGESLRENQDTPALCDIDNHIEIRLVHMLQEISCTTHSDGLVAKTPPGLFEDLNRLGGSFSKSASHGSPSSQGKSSNKS